MLCWDRRELRDGNEKEGGCLEGLGRRWVRGCETSQVRNVSWMALKVKLSSVQECHLWWDISGGVWSFDNSFVIMIILRRIDESRGGGVNGCFGMFKTNCHLSYRETRVRNMCGLLSVGELHVAKRRKHAFGLIGLLLLGLVMVQSAESNLLNMSLDSGLQAPESSNIKAIGRFIAQGKRPYLKLSENLASSMDDIGLVMDSSFVR
ncbi:MAG: hypothetical protein ACKEQK_00475 [Candidatus Hodgkinia cicadicola]